MATQSSVFYNYLLRILQTHRDFLLESYKITNQLFEWMQQYELMFGKHVFPTCLSLPFNLFIIFLTEYTTPYTNFTCSRIISLFWLFFVGHTSISSFSELSSFSAPISLASAVYSFLCVCDAAGLLMPAEACDELWVLIRELWIFWTSTKLAATSSNPC